MKVKYNSNCEICENKNYYVMGKDATGKSTFMLILSGLEKGWLGKIEVFGECPKYYGEGEAKNKISFIPEKPVLLENKTIKAGTACFNYEWEYNVF